MRARWRRLVQWLVVAVSFLLPSAAAFAQAPANAKVLESRLWAPCCYAGTLDTHESTLAHDLRKEIEERVGRGESVEAKVEPSATQASSRRAAPDAFDQRIDAELADLDG